MSKKYENENKIWSEEDRNYLYDIWGEIGIAKISRELKRSPEAVISFASKNGLGGFAYTGAYLTTGQAADIIGVDYTTIIYWIKNKLIKAKLKKLHIKRIYLIDPKDFKGFLIDNQDTWSTLKSDLSIFNGNEDWLLKKIDNDKNNKYKNTNTSWTLKQEEELIKLVNDGYSSKDIADILGRTKESIRRRRGELISQGRLGIDSKIKEDNFVRQFVFDNWGKLSIKELADATNRNEEQIMAIQWKYKLPSLYDIKDEDLFTFIELGQILGITRDCIRRWVVNLGLEKQEINKGNKKRFVININYVLPFLEKNKDRIATKTYMKCKINLEEYFKSKIKEAV